MACVTSTVGELVDDAAVRPQTHHDPGSSATGEVDGESGSCGVLEDRGRQFATPKRARRCRGVSISSTKASA